MPQYSEQSNITKKTAQYTLEGVRKWLESGQQMVRKWSMNGQKLVWNMVCNGQNIISFWLNFSELEQRELNQLNSINNKFGPTYQVHLVKFLSPIVNSIPAYQKCHQVPIAQEGNLLAVHFCSTTECNFWRPNPTCYPCMGAAVLRFHSSRGGETQIPAYMSHVTCSWFNEELNWDDCLKSVVHTTWLRNVFFLNPAHNASSPN